MRIVKMGQDPESKYHVCEKLPLADKYPEGTIVQANCRHYYEVDYDHEWGGPKYWSKLFWRNVWQQLFKGGFTSMDQLRDS